MIRSGRVAKLGAAVALAVTLAAGVGMTAVAGAATQSAMVAAASARASAAFHTSQVRAEFSLRSRRDPLWALVDGTATSRHRLWAAWLHLDSRGAWDVRYFMTTAPFEPTSVAHGRVPCDLVPAFGEPRCHPAPDSWEIKAAVFGQLQPTGRASRIGELLRNGGYSFRFTAPVASSIRLDWYTRANHRLIARATADLLTRRSGDVKLELTPAGVRILRASQTLAVTAELTLTPILYKDVRVIRGFVLTR